MLDLGHVPIHAQHHDVLRRQLAPGRDVPLAGRWQARFALGSLVLHGLLLSLAAGRGRQHAREQVTRGQPELEFDVLANELEVAPTDAHAASDAERRELSRAPRAGTSLKNAARATETDAELATAEAAAAEAPGDGADAPSTTPTDTAPHLGLVALGVDGQNPFLDRGDPVALRAAKAARLKRRLDKSLAQGLMNHDVESGRGAGSPIVRALEAAVYASTVPLNGSAYFTLIIDSEGKLLSSTLGQASGDRESWARVARQTARFDRRCDTAPRSTGEREAVF